MFVACQHTRASMFCFEPVMTVQGHKWKSIIQSWFKLFACIIFLLNSIDGCLTLYCQHEYTSSTTLWKRKVKKCIHDHLATSHIWTVLRKCKFRRRKDNFQTHKFCLDAWTLCFANMEVNHSLLVQAICMYGTWHEKRNLFWEISWLFCTDTCEYWAIRHRFSTGWLWIFHTGGHKFSADSGWRWQKSEGELRAQQCWRIKKDIARIVQSIIVGIGLLLIFPRSTSQCSSPWQV